MGDYRQDLQSSTNHSNLIHAQVMQRVFLLLQSLFSAVRRVLSLSGAALPLIRIILALKRFIRGCFKSPKSSGVSALSRLPESHSTTSQERVQSAQAPYDCMPTFLPNGLCGQPEDTLLLQHSVAREHKPMAPQWFQRYRHRRPVEKKPNQKKIKAGQMTFLEKVPDNWERVVHPKGTCYYFNAKKNVFTDISLTELGDLSELHACIHSLRARENQLLPSPTFQNHPTQLVIQHRDSIWFYYFVNHDTHVTFWVDDFDLAGLIPPTIFGVTEDSHILYAIEMQYWWHCEQYPSSVSLLQEHVTEVWGAVAYPYTDSSKSVTPLHPFNQDEHAKILGVMPYLQARVCTTDSYAMCILAQAMRAIVHARLYHFYGQPGVRLKADMSVYIQQGDHSYESHLTFHLLDFLFGFTLASHVQEVKSIWVDDTVNFAQWSKITTRLMAEWSGFTTFATVMLAVDVSLLSVPVTATNDQLAPGAATYMSILCVFGSLIYSVLLSRQISRIDTSAEAEKFMQEMTYWSGGTIIPAIMFAFPCAFLIWAMFFFALALLSVVFQKPILATVGVGTLGTVMAISVISLPLAWGKDYASLKRWLSSLRSRFWQNSTGGQEPV